MRKPELLKAVCEGLKEKELELTHGQIDTVLVVFEDVIAETISADKSEEIKFGKLGTFKSKNVPERKGIIQLGENKGSEWVKPQHFELTFKVSKAVKELA